MPYIFTYKLIVFASPVNFEEEEQNLKMEIQFQIFRFNNARKEITFSIILTFYS